MADDLVAPGAPPDVPPAPVPTQWQLLRGDDAIVLRVSTPGGLQFVFMDPRSARQLGEALIGMADACEPPIAVAGADDVARLMRADAEMQRRD